MIRAHQLGEERAVAVRQGSGVHRGAADQGVGPDDVEDHEEDQPGATGVRPVEAGVAAVFLGLADDSDDRERGDAEQDGDGEEVLQEAERVPVADERDGEIADDEQSERLDVDGPENEEAPHGEEVGQAGDRPLQQPGLPEHLLELGGDALSEIVLAVVLDAGLGARPDQVRQEEDSLEGEYTDDDEHQDPDNDPDQHLGIHRKPPVLKLLKGNLMDCYPSVTFAQSLINAWAHSCTSRGNDATKAGLTKLRRPCPGGLEA